MVASRSSATPTVGDTAATTLTRNLYAAVSIPEVGRLLQKIKPYAVASTFGAIVDSAIVDQSGTGHCPPGE